jgi:hypothetical protein
MQQLGRAHSSIRAGEVWRMDRRLEEAETIND